jgi:AraC family transcriptional regulator of adaptative response/methylated-DNA-[protein]-cysteine methyltransferase
MTIAMSVPPAPPIGEVRRLRLAQIHDRAPEAEDAFWYSVVTTGVYCRPACPSRRARPENIRLHDTLAQARATGFRPCRRCCPETASVLDRQQASIEAACRLLLHGDPALTLASIAGTVGMSRSHFHRLFRRMTGVTPSAYALQRSPPVGCRRET